RRASGPRCRPARRRRAPEGGTGRGRGSRPSLPPAVRGRPPPDRRVAGDHARSGDPGMTTASRPTIPAERYRDRIAAARDLAAEAGLAAILVGTGADMAYLA